MKQVRFIPAESCNLQMREPQEGQQESREIEGRPIVFGVRSVNLTPWSSIRKVYEVSAVAFPAYEGTTIQAASEGDTLDSARASLESARKQLEEERAKQAEDERRTAALERLNKLIHGGTDND